MHRAVDTVPFTDGDRALWAERGVSWWHLQAICRATGLLTMKPQGSCFRALPSGAEGSPPQLTLLNGSSSNLSSMHNFVPLALIQMSNTCSIPQVSGWNLGGFSPVYLSRASIPIWSALTKDFLLGKSARHTPADHPANLPVLIRATSPTMQGQSTRTRSKRKSVR